MGSRRGELLALHGMAQALGRQARLRKPGPRKAADLPSLWLFTDPDRTPDLEASIRVLPPGCGVVLRTFGRREIEAQASALRRHARKRGLVFLIGADAALARHVGADGVHLPQRLIHMLPRLKARFPLWTLTAAAHDGPALRRAAEVGADAAFLSPVFESLSPSAGTPLGVTRTSGLVRAARLPVYALGGVRVGTVSRLRGTGVSGIAGVEFASAREADGV